MNPLLEGDKTAKKLSGSLAGKVDFEYKYLQHRFSFDSVVLNSVPYLQPCMSLSPEIPFGLL